MRSTCASQLQPHPHPRSVARTPAFRDHFINLPFDLSRVLFIATANELEPIPRPLRDRMEVIEMSGYTVQEKVRIAARHLLPKQRKLHGLTDVEIDIDGDAIDALISGYTLEAGVRELDRHIATLCRWVAARAAEAREAAEVVLQELAPDDAGIQATKAGVRDSAAKGGGDPESAARIPDGIATPAAVEGTLANVGGGVSRSSGSSCRESGWGGGVMRSENIEKILGPPKYDGPRDNVHRVSKAGVAVGLAYTPVGGDVLFVEAETMRGSGGLTITGKLGDVMVESVKIAQAWVRAHALELGLQKCAEEQLTGPLLNATDLHIHFPAGAMPKDGPSAGVTITTAIVSLMKGWLVKPDLAMTGEITLHGLVLPVGGMKEKLIAAHRAGMAHVLIPNKNEKDLRELPQNVIDELNVTLVKDISEVLRYALTPTAEAAEALPESCGGAHGEEMQDVSAFCHVAQSRAAILSPFGPRS